MRSLSNVPTLNGSTLINQWGGETVKKLAIAAIFGFALSSASPTFADENEKFWIFEALSECAERIELRGMGISPSELYDLHLQGELTPDRQKLPGWLKNSCKNGLEDWIETQEWYKKFERFAYRLVPYLINPSVIVEKDEEVKVRVSPLPSEPKTYSPMRIKFGLGISIKPGEFIGGDPLEGFSPYLKADGNYYSLKGRLKVHPFREMMKFKLSYENYLFDIARPDISYKWQWGEEKKHSVDAGLTFKTPYPELQARIYGSMNVEDSRDWSVNANLYGYWNWECVLLKLVQKCIENR